MMMSRGEDSCFFVVDFFGVNGGGEVILDFGGMGC